MIEAPLFWLCAPFSLSTPLSYQQHNNTSTTPFSIFTLFLSTPIPFSNWSRPKGYRGAGYHWIVTCSLLISWYGVSWPAECIVTFFYQQLESSHVFLRLFHHYYTVWINTGGFLSSSESLHWYTAPLWVPNPLLRQFYSESPHRYTAPPRIPNPL